MESKDLQRSLRKFFTGASDDLHTLMPLLMPARTLPHASIRQHTSAYVSIRQHTLRMPASTLADVDTGARAPPRAAGAAGDVLALLALCPL